MPLLDTKPRRYLLVTIVAVVATALVMVFMTASGSRGGANTPTARAERTGPIDPGSGERKVGGADQGTPAAAATNAPEASDQPDTPERSATRAKNDAGAEPVIVVTLDGSKARTPQTSNDEVRRQVPSSASLEGSANTIATPPTASATGTAHSLEAPHGPGAVVEEPNCGSVRDGRYVPPEPPHGDLVCTVNEVVGGSVVTTTYRVAAEQ